MKRFAFAVLGVTALIAGLALRSGVEAQTTTVPLQMALSNPTNATTATRNYGNYLKTRQIGPPSNPAAYQNRYAESYSRFDGIPNWVSWHLSVRDSNNAASRQDNFRADTDLPSGWQRLTGSSFGSQNGVTYDRGHMCPSGDRTDSVASNSATFVMTNFIPQTSDNNQGPWERFETYCRALTDSGSEVYIIAGDDGSLGKLNLTDTSGATFPVTIPTNVWKVAVVISDDGATGDTDAGGSADLNRIVNAVRANTGTTSVRVIAVDMPNIAGIRSNSWQSYITTPRTLENYTGYNLLSYLPQDVQDVLENRRDNGTSN